MQRSHHPAYLDQSEVCIQSHVLNTFATPFTQSWQTLEDLFARADPTWQEKNSVEKACKTRSLASRLEACIQRTRRQRLNGRITARTRPRRFSLGTQPQLRPSQLNGLLSPIIR